MAGELREIKNVLFDLDGTLTDNSVGITACLRYALNELGRPAPDPANLLWCIGPPLRASFRRLLGLSDEQLAYGTADQLIGSLSGEFVSDQAVEEGVRLYRVRYEELGWSENLVYPGIPDLLSRLETSGRQMALTTTKAQPLAERIALHFSLMPPVLAVYGPSNDGRMSAKSELVAHAIERLGLEPGSTVIIGDRDLDIAGGRANGIQTVGVTYGFGTAMELESARADHIVTSVIELVDLFE